MSFIFLTSILKLKKKTSKQIIIKTKNKAEKKRIEEDWISENWCEGWIEGDDVWNGLGLEHGLHLRLDLG